jgi:hypothetical protein
VPTPQDIPGYTRDGDWFVPVKERALVTKVRSTPAPRDYGPWDQLKLDLRTPKALVAYVVCFGLIVHGLLTEAWFELLAGVGGVLLFSRGFLSSIALVRGGVVSVARIERVPDAATGQGVVQVQADGRPMNVFYELAVVRALLDEDGAVEMEIVYDPAEKAPNAQAMVYRRISASERVSPQSAPPSER